MVGYAAPSTITDIPATWDTLKVGQRVKCIYPNNPIINLDRHGKTGKVLDKNEDNGDIFIEWDDGATQHPQWGDAGSFTILSDTNSPVVSPTTVAINDHVCPSCKNDRCSRYEKSCWKCGGVL